MTRKVWDKKPKGFSWKNRLQKSSDRIFTFITKSPQKRNIRARNTLLLHNKRSTEVHTPLLCTQGPFVQLSIQTTKAQLKYRQILFFLQTEIDWALYGIKAKPAQPFNCMEMWNESVLRGLYKDMSSIDPLKANSCLPETCLRENDPPLTHNYSNACYFMH